MYKYIQPILAVVVLTHCFPVVLRDGVESSSTLPAFGALVRRGQWFMVIYSMPLDRGVGQNPSSHFGLGLWVM
jgi:hypothetical protein